MSLSLTASEAFVNWDINNDGAVNNTLNDYLLTFSGFTAGTWDTLSGANFNGGGFGRYHGTQFGLKSIESESSFVASATDGNELYYTLFSSPRHTMYGDLDVLDLGSGAIDKSTDVWETGTPMVEITGLSSVTNGGIYENGEIIDQSTGENDVHNIVYGLMSGDASALAEILSAAGVDLNAEITEAGSISVYDAGMEYEVPAA